MTDMTKLTAAQLQQSIEMGVPLDEVLRLVQGTEVGGPTLPEVIARARRDVGRASSGSLPSLNTHWRRLEKGIAVPPASAPTILEVASAHGMDDLDPDPASYPVVHDYHGYQKHPRPMAVIRPADPTTKLLAVDYSALLEHIEWTRIMVETTRIEHNRTRRDEGRPDRRLRGDAAVNTFCGAWNKLFEIAWTHKLIPEQAFNPLIRYRRPDQDPDDKEPLSSEQLAELWWAVNNDRYDPELYAMLYRFHLLTGAREEGAINLNLSDLDDYHQAVWLDEKNDRKLKIPTRPGFLDEIRTFAASRGSTAPDDPAFLQKKRQRNDDGELVRVRISGRTYNKMHANIKAQLDWAAQIEFGVHWLRGNAAAAIESVSNVACKKRFLRQKHNAAVDRYAPAKFSHVAWAVGRQHGFEHPHAKPYPGLQ